MPKENQISAAVSQRTSILSRAIRQSLLMAAFIIGVLTLVSFIVARSMLEDSILALTRGGSGIPFWMVNSTLQKAGLSDAQALATTLFTIAGLMTVFAILLAILLARGLTQPLRRLAQNVQGIIPGSWEFQRSVHTGDEVETLDAVVDDLVKRLKVTYDHLEEEVADRTQELRKQYVFEKAILQSISYGVVTVDSEGNITGHNPAAEQILDMSIKQIDGKSIADVMQLAEKGDEVQKNDHPVLQCLQSKTLMRSGRTQAFTVRNGKEKHVPISIVAAPLMQEENLLGAVLVFQDVTEERRIDEMKSEFITLASHQLRTPLSIINWYIDLLSGEEANKEGESKEYLSEMATAARRMTNLLNALLQVSRLEDEKATTTITEVHVRNVIEGIMEEAKKSVGEKKITCETNLPDEDCILRTDEDLLKVLLQNLLSNSIKYCKDECTVSLHVSKNEKHMCFAVKDTGMGIPILQQKEIFKKFFRAQNVKEIDTDGSGLGLYICKMITEELGGDIVFESTEGKGTVFTVYLPLNSPESTKKTATSPEGEAA